MEEGRIEEGCTILGDGLNSASSTGIFYQGANVRATLASAHFRAGRHRIAALLLDEALDLCARTGEAWIEAELHRRGGELCSGKYV